MRYCVSCLPRHVPAVAVRRIARCATARGLLRRHGRIRSRPDGAAGVRDNLPAGVHRNQRAGAPVTHLQCGGSMSRFAHLHPAGVSGVRQGRSRSLDQSVFTGYREHRSRTGIHRSRAHRRSGAMGPGAQALAAAARRGRSQPLALGRDGDRRPRDPQSLWPRHRRTGHHLHAHQLAARHGAHHCPQRRGRAARHGVPGDLYPGPNAAPAAGASRVRHDPEKWEPVFRKDHAPNNFAPSALHLARQN